MTSIIVYTDKLTGRRAFDGDSIESLCRAILNDQPPALTGGGANDAVDRVIQKALSKRPGDRYASAKAMAEALVGAKPASDATIRLEPVRTVRRLIVLPFRLLRPDPEIEFLSFGLADAVSLSLSHIESLLVRSSAAAARYASEVPDPKQLAVEASVDAVVYGTLLRAGDQVRVSVQLVEAPAGTVLCSTCAQGRMEGRTGAWPERAGGHGGRYTSNPPP